MDLQFFIHKLDPVAGVKDGRRKSTINLGPRPFSTNGYRQIIGAVGRAAAAIDFDLHHGTGRNPSIQGRRNRGFLAR